MVNSRDPVLTFENVGLKDLEKAAKQMLLTAGDRSVWLFLGDMGAGKTTFIKALASVLNITDTVASPTYGIVNEYVDNNGESYYHFDFYRINDESEAEDIGAVEYFDSGNYCFIEWPQRVERLLPDRYVSVSIQTASPTTRRLEMRMYD